MRHQCPVCGLHYYRESGYFLGAVILNYVFTTLLVVSCYLLAIALRFETVLHGNLALMLWILFGVILSLALVRHSYSLWLSLDYWLEPWGPGREDRE